MEGELSSEGIKGCYSRQVRLFESIELSVAVKRIYVNKTKVIHMRLKSLQLLVLFIYFSF